jgi:hypothetical protein
MYKLYLLSVVALLSGCADYLNHYETVTLAAGDAQKHNMLLQAVDSFNPATEDTHIPGSGIRAVDAVNAYRYKFHPQEQQQGNVTVNVGDGGGGGGNCPKGAMYDAAGNKCGKRSAENRPGGKTGNEPD